MGSALETGSLHDTGRLHQRTKAHGRQWQWQYRARQRGEAAVGPARAAVARVGGCSDGGSGHEQGLRCRALVAAAA